MSKITDTLTPDVLRSAAALPPIDGSNSLWAVPEEELPRVTRLLRARAQLSAEEIAALTSRQASRQQRVSGAVAVISIRGMITPRGSFWSGSGGLEFLRESFREALADSDIAGIVLDIDSPGGLTDMVTETARVIRAARGEKPIAAVANAMAASAAYYLASQADEVVCTTSGRVGSIGVFLIHDDWSKFNEDFGVKPTYISAGKFKTDGNPDEPLSETARTAFQQQVDELYDLFVADVAAGRGVPEATVRDGYGQGRVLQAKAALAAGLADRIGTLDETISRVASGDVKPTTPRSIADDPAPDPEAKPPAPDPAVDPAPAPAGGDPAPEPKATPPAPDPEPEPEPDPAPTQQSAQTRRRVADVLFG